MKLPINTIGYGAVVVPHLDEFQGYYIVDDKSLHQQAVMMQMTALATNPQGVIGALQSAVVEGVITGRPDIAQVAALALHGITKTKFYWIKATKASGGTTTEMFPLEVTTIDEARDVVNSLPEVIEMKKRLVAGATMKRKH